MILIGKQYPEAVQDALSTTDNAISMCVYAMSPRTPTTHPRHSAFLAAITDPPKRGIHCSAIFSHLQQGSHGRDANIMIMRQLRDAGWHIRVMSSRPIMHAKLIIIDKKTAFLGSHNLTDSALYINHEVSIRIDQPTHVYRLHNMFDSMWQVATPHQP